MANEKEKPTPEEMREYGVNMLSSPVADIASAALVVKAKYGDVVLSDVENYIYMPAYISGVWAQAMDSEELEKKAFKSRVKEKPFAGEISFKDHEILESCLKRVMFGASLVNVSDIAKLMGNETELAGNYAKMSMAEYLKSDEEGYKNLLGGYQIYLAKMTVANASEEGACAIREKSLEGIVIKPEESQKAKSK